MVLRRVLCCCRVADKLIQRCPSRLLTTYYATRAHPPDRQRVADIRTLIQLTAYRQHGYRLVVCNTERDGEQESQQLAACRNPYPPRTTAAHRRPVRATPQLQSQPCLKSSSAPPGAVIQGVRRQSGGASINSPQRQNVMNGRAGKNCPVPGLARAYNRTKSEKKPTQT